MLASLVLAAGAAVAQPQPARAASAAAAPDRLPLFQRRAGRHTERHARPLLRARRGRPGSRRVL